MTAVTWLGHSTVLIETGGARLLTDPVLRPRVAHLTRRAAAVDVGELGPLDAVLLSHVHRDHLDVPTLRQIAGGRSGRGSDGSRQPDRRRADGARGRARRAAGDRQRDRRGHPGRARGPAPLPHGAGAGVRGRRRLLRGRHGRVCRHGRPWSRGHRAAAGMGMGHQHRPRSHGPVGGGRGSRADRPRGRRCRSTGARTSPRTSGAAATRCCATPRTTSRAMLASARPGSASWCPP